MRAWFRKFRPVDLLPMLFVVTVGGLSLWVDRPFYVDREALGAWAIFTALWVLIVALPTFVRFDTSFWSARYQNLPGHVLLIVLGVLFLFLNSWKGLFDPVALTVLGVLAFLIYGLQKRKAQFHAKTFLYAWSPVILSFFMYQNLRWFVSNLNPNVMDSFLAELDLMLFGVHLTLISEQYQTPFLSDWFSFHYGAYVLYPLLTGLLFYYEEKREAFEDFALGFGLCMYLGFVGYVCIPAVGPISGLLELYSTPTVPGSDLSAFREAVVEKYRYIRDAFPSLHTANSLFCVLLIRRHYPRLFWVALFFEANLLLSTIYLRMHYTVDVVAGVLLALLALWLAPRINRAAGVPHSP